MKYTLYYSSNGQERDLDKGSKGTKKLMSIHKALPQRNYRLFIGKKEGARGVMVIVEGNGRIDTS